MAEKYRPTMNERVRVVLEGPVVAAIPDGFVLGELADGGYIRPDSKHVVSVERLPDPEPEWEPGDIAAVSSGRAYAYLGGGTWRDTTTGVTYVHSIMPRPLTPLVRDGRLWREGDR